MLADKTMDEEMAADWAAIKEKHATEAPEPVEVEAEAPAEVEAEPVKDERPRDESGKFAKAPKEAKPAKAEAAPEPAEPAKEPAKAEAAPAPVEAEAAPQDATQRDVNRPPSTWKPTARSEWEKLPPSVKAEIHRRESDFMNGQSQLLPDAKLGSAIRQVAQPYTALIQAEGSDPQTAFASYLRTSAVFRMGTPQQKLQAIQTIAQTHGIDLSAFAQQQPQQGQPPPQLTQQGQFYDPRVDQILAAQRQQDMERQQAEASAREAVANKFLNEAGTDGKPLRPYVGDVMEQMSALIPVIRAEQPGVSHDKVLQEAYDRSCWANPEIRALLQQAQMSQLETQRRTDNQQRVREARRASSVNVPRRASTPSPAKPGSMDDTIVETARALGLVN